LSAAEQAAIVARVLALPPLTEEQIDRLCEVIHTARTRWRDQDSQRDEQDRDDLGRDGLGRAA